MPSFDPSGQGNARMKELLAKGRYTVFFLFLLCSYPITSNTLSLLSSLLALNYKQAVRYIPFFSKASLSKLLHSYPMNSILIQCTPFSSNVLHPYPMYSDLIQCTPILSKLLHSYPMYSVFIQCTPSLSNVLRPYPMYSIIIQCTPSLSSVLRPYPMYSILIQCTPTLSNVLRCFLIVVFLSETFCFYPRFRLYFFHILQVPCSLYLPLTMCTSRTWTR